VNVAATDTNFFHPRFEPFDVTVAPSDTVLVRNTGEDRHSFTWSSNRTDVMDLIPGASGSFVATLAPGDYRFYCKWHASAAAEPGPDVMAGVLRVRVSSGPPGNDTDGLPNNGTGSHNNTSAPPSNHSGKTKNQPGFETIAVFGAITLLAAIVRRS
jgi:hypothetical protein